MGAVGVAPGTSTLELPDGTTIALQDWIDDKHYGVGQLQSGSSSVIQLFSAGRSQQIPGGQSGRTLNKVDTNIPRSGDNGLQKDWEGLWYGLGLQISRVSRPPTGQSQPIFPDASQGGAAGAFSDPASLRTMFNLDRILAFDYQYNGKSYSQGVLTQYPQGYGFNLVATTSATELAQNGVPSPRDRVAMVLPIHERENLSYTMVIEPQANIFIGQPASDSGATLTFADIKCIKSGLIKRPVV